MAGNSSAVPEADSFFSTLLKAFSASTVLARVDAFRDELAETGGAGQCVAVVRVVDRIDDEGAWPVPYWYQRRPTLRRQLSFDEVGLETDRWFWRRCGDLFRANSRVPTTLFAVRPETALGLVVHGYCGTRVGLIKAGLADSGAWPVPPLMRFADVVGVPVHEHAKAGWLVGRGNWNAPKAAVAQLARPVDQVLRDTNELNAACDAAEKVRAALDEWLEASRRMRAHGEAARARRRRLRQAFDAHTEGNDKLACEIYAECDASGALDASQLLTYATALGLVTPGTGTQVAGRAEAAAREVEPELLSTFWFAYLLARCYAINGDVIQAVSSLRRIIDTAEARHLPREVASDTGFERIRTEPILAALLNDVAAHSASVAVVT